MFVFWRIGSKKKVCSNFTYRNLIVFVHYSLIVEPQGFVLYYSSGSGSSNYFEYCDIWNGFDFVLNNIILTIK